MFATRHPARQLPTAPAAESVRPAAPVVLITGASSGIGAATAAHFAAAAWRVFATACTPARVADGPNVLALDVREERSGVARAIHEAATTRSPRLRYPVGRDAAVLAPLRRVLPERAFSRALRRPFALAAATP